MGSDFGEEFKNLQRLFEEGGTIFPDPYLDSRELDASRYFNEIRSLALAIGRSVLPVLPPQGIIFYIPPGRFRLRHTNFDLTRRTVYELPENVELYVCQGALIRPEEGVDLVIRGSVRAGPYQIFGYDQWRPHVRDELGLNTVPLGRIIFAGKRVPAIYPEWWGATPVLIGTPPNATREAVRLNDSSDALQAAFDAACVTSLVDVAAPPDQRLSL